jgi:nitroimidazol reductase NimA-like FMN-containing flavoprotein (pyridoxamine 5'-phosphate oxidase superfamily)
MVSALMTMPFGYIDCSNNAIDPPYITEVYNTFTDKLLFVITLFSMGESQVIKIVSCDNDVCVSLMSINLSEIFETTYVDKFCQLRGFDEFCEFLNDPLNNTRQI